VKGYVCKKVSNFLHCQREFFLSINIVDVIKSIKLRLLLEKLGRSFLLKLANFPRYLTLSLLWLVVT
jgi:hypothetical protein